MSGIKLKGVRNYFRDWEKMTVEKEKIKMTKMGNKFFLLVLISVLTLLLVTGCKNEESKGTDTTSDQQSSSSEVEKTKHAHKHQEGFTDDEIKDRTLADWSKEWQSVYPFVVDGTLDEVFKQKEKAKHEKTFAEYKEYYTKGYQTEVERIEIKENTVSFLEKESIFKGEYQYEGYRILTYESGNRGVRYLFTKESGDEQAPKHIQFSDHEIGPKKVTHFHLYFGNESHETLLKELENWPTYYPQSMTGADIVHDMLHDH